MLFTIWLILVHGIAFISGEVGDMHYLHEERRVVETDYKRGYISIDCGNDEPDQTSGILYSSDAAFIDTGINKQISSEFTFNGIYKTVRSFPDGVRNCYTLKPLNGRANNYLIRAQFMYGNYDGENRPPIFDLYIGVNVWQKVNLSTTTQNLFFEIVHKPTTDSINICLVNIGQGTPFITALLLRPLNNSIYNSDLGSLTNIVRYNTGVKGAGGYYSYPDDVYDRFWGSLPRAFISWKHFGTSTDLTSITNDAYKVPPSILKSGARPVHGNRSLTYYETLNPQEVFYVYWHFAETQKLGDNDSREFNIFLNGNLQAGPISPKYVQPMTIASSPIRLESGDSEIYFFINQTNTSTLPPILNALEIYSVTELQQSATNLDDVKAIMDVKTKYWPMGGWQGDPCLPVSPWDGLNCSDNGFHSPRITALNLASRGLTGELPPSLSSLTSLKYLNLSNNSLAGTIPKYLAKMPSLQVIDLRGNKLSGSVPVELREKMNNGLLSLRFHYF